MIIYDALQTTHTVLKWKMMQLNICNKKITFVRHEEWLCRVLCCTAQQEIAGLESSRNMQSQLPSQSRAKRKHFLFEVARAVSCLVFLDNRELTIKRQPRRTGTKRRSAVFFFQQIISSLQQMYLVPFGLRLIKKISGQSKLVFHCRLQGITREQKEKTNCCCFFLFYFFIFTASFLQNYNTTRYYYLLLLLFRLFCRENSRPTLVGKE